MSEGEADAVLATMRAREVAVDLQPWSRRFRAYTEMIKSGAPHEVAKVLRDMHRLRFDKELRSVSGDCSIRPRACSSKSSRSPRR